MQQRGSGVAAFVAASAAAAAVAVAVDFNVKTNSHALIICCKLNVRMYVCMRLWVEVYVGGVGSAALLTTAGVEYVLTFKRNQINFAWVCAYACVWQREVRRKRINVLIFSLMPFADCGAATGSAQSATSREYEMCLLLRVAQLVSTNWQYYVEKCNILFT